MRLSSKIAIRVAALSVAATAIGLPITAVQATAAAGPTITVTPNSNLKSGTTVTVSGTGFPQHNATIYVVECSGTSGQAACDISTVDLSQKTTGTGSFSGAKVTVHTGKVGNGKCLAGKSNCIIAASTSTSGVKADSDTAPITFKAVASIKTTTSAKASAKKVPATKKFTISGTVKAAGKGVSGLKVVLYDRATAKKAWKKLSTLTTNSGGKFKSGKLKGPKSSEQYLVKHLKGAHGGKTYGASSSKVITVKA